MTHMLLNLLGAVAEFEKSLLKERQREGIDAAKKRGVYTGRKPTLSPQQVLELKEKTRLGVSKARIAQNFRKKLLGTVKK